jgi:hypothetical protein
MLKVRACGVDVQMERNARLLSRKVDYFWDIGAFKMARRHWTSLQVITQNSS